MIDRRTVLIALGSAVATPRAAAAMEVAGDVPIDVPISLEGGHRITTAVTFGKSEPHLFLLDSGGQSSLIDAKVARSLDMTIVGTRALQVGVLESRRYDIVSARDMAVGGVFLTPSVQFAAIDHFPFGKGIDGSFNGGFLTIYPSEIVFDANVWRLWKTRLPALPGYTRISQAVLRQPNGDGAAFLRATVMVNGVPLLLGVDTGTSGSLRLTHATAKRLGLLSDERPTRPLVSNGRKLGTLVRVDSVSMAGIDLGRPVALIADIASTIFPDGLIGLRLLQMMNLAVDPVTGDLWVRRNRQAPLGDMVGDEGL